MRSRTAAATAASATAALAFATVFSSPAHAADPSISEEIREAMTVESVMGHLEQFQAIADANDGNRAAGTSGYEASAAYVEETLQAAGYTTERQTFPFTYEEVHDYSLTEVSPGSGAIESNPMSYSPATPDGGITAELAEPTNAIGCTDGDYAGADVDGKIALVSRGECSFADKAVAAKAAGAEAAIVYNNEAGELNGTLGEVNPDAATATGVSQATGQELLEKMTNGPVEVSILLDKTLEERETFNVLAETETGSEDDVIMLGAHLDSDIAGPGINDNASGSAAILETAVQLQEAGDHKNKVRFAFWGAEELGLVGSNHYVADLQANDPAGLEAIETYLNFDMVASPNHIIGVLDANESTYEAPVEVPEGSANYEAVFTDYFEDTEQAWVDSEFSGRSDYSAFIDAGVPSTGLFTGADGVKTDEQVEMFGGTAGDTYDPNYHTAADDINNINTEALDIMIDAIAHATITLAEPIEKPGKPENPGKPEVPEVVQTDGVTGTTPSGWAAGGLVLAGLSAAGVVVARRRTEQH